MLDLHTPGGYDQIMADQLPSIRGLDERARATIDARISARYGTGASVRSIAKQVGRSYGYVYASLARSGVQLRARGGRFARREDGVTA